MAQVVVLLGAGFNRSMLDPSHDRLEEIERYRHLDLEACAVSRSTSKSA
jgi:hypothetical protein